MEESLGLNTEQLRDLAIICGCDFHRKGVPGLGPRKGAVHLRRYGDLISVLKAQGFSRDEIKEFAEAREVFDEGEYLKIAKADLSLKPPLRDGLLKIIEPSAGEIRAQKIVMELVRLWKDFGKVQTTLEQWI
jgi:5'-3' exonuclease